MSNFLVIEFIVPPPPVLRDSILGTDQADVLNGDRPDRTVEGFADSISGLGGDDLIEAGLGDDEVFGGDGDDDVRGGAGDDVLYGEAGDDRLDGGDGDDVLYPIAGSNELIGGAGFDILNFDFVSTSVVVDMAAGTATYGDGSVDVFSGIEGFADASRGARIIVSDDQPLIYQGENSSNDVLDLSRLAAGVTAYLDPSAALFKEGGLTEPLTGQAFDGGDSDWTGTSAVGFDSAIGTAFDDQLHGTFGDNELFGGAGRDVLAGFDGDDDLLGGIGEDTLFGGEGDDFLVGGLGSDALFGGGGFDMAAFGDFDAGVVVNLTRGEAWQADGDVDALFSIEDLAGTDFNDVMAGDAGDNIIFGGAGNDRLNGGAGADILLGGAGHDRYFMHDPNDFVVEAADEGDDRISTWVDYWNDDNVEVLSGRHADHGLLLIGHGDAERIYGSVHGDRIDGWRGSDWLAGLAGDDRINGGAGADRLYGNSGDDYLRGGGGDDRLTGGFGDDRFVHRPGDGADVVTDFDWNGDILDLSAHGIESFRDFQIMTRDTAEGALVDMGDDGSILLLGIAEADIRREDVEL